MAEKAIFDALIGECSRQGGAGQCAVEEASSRRFCLPVAGARPFSLPACGPPRASPALSPRRRNAAPFLFPRRAPLPLCLPVAGTPRPFSLPACGPPRASPALSPRRRNAPFLSPRLRPAARLSRSVSPSVPAVCAVCSMSRFVTCAHFPCLSLILCFRKGLWGRL